MVELHRSRLATRSATAELDPVTYSPSMPEIIDVAVEQDHLQRLVRPSRPIAGVAELVWNSLDADASQVLVSVARNDLTGIEEVRVTDNGHGMTHDEARTTFGTLGGSWKREKKRSNGQKRVLHGSEGKGRWRAFALGRHVVWTSVSGNIDGATRELVTVTGTTANLRQFEIGDPISTNNPRGTTVVVCELAEDLRGLDADQAVPELTTVLALYLQQYQADVQFDGESLDPASKQLHRADYALQVEGLSDDLNLTVIEWDFEVDRALHLCDENGVSLEVERPGVQAPGFSFTGYLKWKRFRDMEADLILGEQLPVTRAVLDAARDKLREHFRERTAEATRLQIEAWKTEKVYPYAEEPTTNPERTERQLFDVVALTASRVINSATDANSKRLSLRLMREALEQSPASLHRVLREVLNLPADRLEELAQLLGRTTLTAIIATSKLVADRLEFVHSLEILLFDQESKKTLLERSQLHRILANETWIFGEELALTADDESLRTVLLKHIKLLGRDAPAADEALDEAGRRLIVDLMLARAVPQAAKRRQHLVIELKRPSVVVGAGEIEQIKKYAFQVIDDERFSKTEVQWDFWLICNAMDGYAENDLRKDNPATPGLLWEDPARGVRIWLRTWAQVIADCEHRLKYVQGALEYLPDDDSALQYLRNAHAKYLPDHLTDPGAV
jgi:hypothetical protein